MSCFFAGSIVMGEKKCGLEEQRRWAKGGQGKKDQWQQSKETGPPQMRSSFHSHIPLGENLKHVILELHFTVQKSKKLKV